MDLKDIVKQAYDTEIEKGWQKEGEQRPVPELICLMHSELSEALEEYRNGEEPNEIYYVASAKDPNPKKPEGIPIELADVIIRIAGFCGQYGIDLDEAVRIKLEFNKTRPARHGGKKI